MARSTFRQLLGDMKGRISAELYKASPEGQSESYRQALLKAAYANQGPQYAQALQGITGQLAGLGPLADSGARVALPYRLASQMAGQIQGQVGTGYANLLGNLIRQRQAFMYQQQLMKQQQKAQKKNFWDYAVPAATTAGAALLSPGMARAGGGGGGGTIANDAYIT